MNNSSLRSVRLMTILTVCLAASAIWLQPRAVARRMAPPKSKKTVAIAKPSAEVAAGKKVYDSSGCAGCHAIAGNGGNSGPDLTQTGSDPTHTPKWLADQVSNPKAHTPASTMPAFAKTIHGKDLTALSVYLASLKSAPSAAGSPAAHSGSAPNPAAVAKIEGLGGHVQQIAQNDDHLDVSFSMAGASVTDASLTALAGLKNVEQLDLGKTAITDAGLAHIKGLTGLTELHLENTKITDAGLANLAQMHELYYLNLYGDNITDAGLEHLRGLTKLRRLFVWQTKVTDAGVNKLKQELPQLEIVRGWDEAPKK